MTIATIADFHIHGYDVSHAQPAAMDFTDHGRRFAIVKATQGVGFVDPHFAANRKAGHDQGLIMVGMYHFATPLQHAAADEAHHFLATVGPLQPGERLFLDFEKDPKFKDKDPWDEAWAVTFLDIIKGATGHSGFYTYSAMLKAHPHTKIRATGTALWLAAYPSAPGTAPVTDWPWDVWQHTDGQASVAGNDGGCDCSVFHSNNPADLAAFAGGTTQGEPDMTPDEHNLLQDCRNILGNLQDLSGAFIQPVLTQIKADVDSPDTHGGAGQITTAAIDAIAKAVLDGEADRLKA